jgi:hypothetical protein
MEIAEIRSGTFMCSVLVVFEGIKPERVKIVGGFWADEEYFLGAQEFT